MHKDINAFFLLFISFCDVENSIFLQLINKLYQKTLKSSNPKDLCI